MKHIIVRKYKDYDGNWTISNVQTENYWTLRNKTIDQVKEEIKKCTTDKCKWEVIEVSDEVAEIIRFTVGEDEYARQVDRRDVYRELKEVIDKLNEIESDMYEISDNARTIIDTCADIFEEEE